MVPRGASAALLLHKVIVVELSWGGSSLGQNKAVRYVHFPCALHPVSWSAHEHAQEAHADTIRRFSTAPASNAEGRTPSWHLVQRSGGPERACEWGAEKRTITSASWIAHPLSNSSARVSRLNGLVVLVRFGPSDFFLLPPARWSSLFGPAPRLECQIQGFYSSRADLCSVFRRSNSRFAFSQI